MTLEKIYQHLFNILVDLSFLDESGNLDVARKEIRETIQIRMLAPLQ